MSKIAGLLRTPRNIAEKKALEKYPKAYFRNGGGIDDANASDRAVYEEGFEEGAEWQKQHMKEALQTEYEKGRFDMMEEMMKNTVLETKVMMDCDGDGIETPYEEWLTLENTEILYIPEELGLKDGDKVKIIIVKDE